MRIQPASETGDDVDGRGKPPVEYRCRALTIPADRFHDIYGTRPIDTVDLLEHALGVIPDPFGNGTAIEDGPWQLFLRCNAVHPHIAFEVDAAEAAALREHVYLVSLRAQR